MTPLTLRSEDARVAYLATVYHLGRPGAEVDRETRRDEGTGLRAVSEASSLCHIEYGGEAGE